MAKGRRHHQGSYLVLGSRCIKCEPQLDSGPHFSFKFLCNQMFIHTPNKNQNIEHKINQGFFLPHCWLYKRNKKIQKNRRLITSAVFQNRTTYVLSFSLFLLPIFSLKNFLFTLVQALLSYLSFCILFCFSHDLCSFINCCPNQKLLLPNLGSCCCLFIFQMESVSICN